ncbi:Lrp/AsnC family transcriptional regulator [Streptomyces sp. NPDC050803]|uniref:Lrp/AsnC family transcriptional regulator n=1 Tax=unclassified Streptomyces TaxID=2593676 RepID=UPI003412821E
MIEASAKTPESGFLPTAVQESGGEARLDGGPVEFTEQDFVLLDALQAAPRAPWSRIGRALGVDATTAARRWERLRAGGLAWVTAYDAAKGSVVAFVEVSCRPNALEAVSAAACALPWVFSVDETAGNHDLLLSVAAADAYSLGRAVRRSIGGIKGVRRARIRFGIRLYSEGGDWRIRALDAAGRDELGAPLPPRPTSYATRGRPGMSAEDELLITALGEDGRLGWASLGARTGLGEYTARRRVQRMLREGAVTLRCDFAQPLAGLPTGVFYRMTVPHAQQDETACALARLPQVRLCAAVSGPYDLLVQVLLPGMEGIHAFETLLGERFPALETRDRTVLLHTPKRMGWLLDERGRAVGRRPLAPPAP